MGRKNKKKGGKNKRHQPPLPPLGEDFKQNLYLEGIKYLTIKALEGINKLKLSKELFLQKQVKEAYLLSKSWLETWKIHVGYDAVFKGEQPGGKKYGRQQIGEMNKDIVANAELFHSAPELYFYFDSPLNDVQPVKDYILITQDVWEFFCEKYKGKAVKRIANEQGEFNLMIISPYVIFMTQDKLNEIGALNQNQVTNSLDLLRMRKAQMFSEWKFRDLETYCQQIMENQDIQIWLMNPIYEQSQIKLQLIKAVHQNKNVLLGEQLLEAEYQQLQLSQFLKNHFILVVFSNKVEISQLDVKFELNQNGCCFNCGSKALLNYSCACKKNFIQDNAQKPYDSQDDDDFDAITYDNLSTKQGVGLTNLGNTCYMNSSLQSLFSATHLQEFLSNKQYWTQNTIKRNVQLNYKLEKLLKNLLTQNKAFSPYSFRQQLARKYPFFGNNFQQDAAEFILYLFDALNEELIQKDGNQKPENELQQQLDLGDGDKPEPEQANSDSEDDSSEEQENSEAKPAQQQQMQFHKKQINNDNYEQAQELIHKLNSSFILKNYLGITRSEIECPICEQKTQSYEQFLILPLSLNATSQSKHLVDVFVISNDWYKPYEKIVYEYQPNQTLLLEVKRDIGEKLGIEATYLLGAFCSNSLIDTYLFHDEDHLSKVLNDNQNGYFCLFQLDQSIYSITDEDQYFDVMIYSFEKRNAFSYQCEYICAAIPKILIIKKQFTAVQIYQQVWNKLGEHSKSDQLMNIQIDEPQQENLLNSQQLKEILNYQVIIQTRLPSKIPCPFICGKQFKKDQKPHSCELPFNNSTTLHQYLEKINYANAHTSLSIEFLENAIPNTLRIEFEPKTNYQKHDKSLNVLNLIDNFQSKEPLMDENAYHCTICNDLTFAIKTMSLQKLPDQLIIQLKRFQYDEHKGFQKNNILVTYPEDIQINQIDYELYGVVLHFGGLDNGHYIAYGRRQKKWIEFNDDTTKEVKQNDVINDKNAYILFYQQK
ncbi:unnamed protein product (macronuclear) [Paramecium tetraurelia]|uniref:Ubiquitin carboxyl-terminal hydrolase n=1 Tax=Paramecium tetraurelia TaxID=5888 RepID=A0DM99_PARTE|nr:uncharacterized protein GSPATT00018384001 [Paramecium tetraurelia]CAK84166.1 unnamed protein product [Paramecium tetraurelia]|eukprot:XP_001451563.1 hypothetical protein (macronuclear) [Paramecium tetraurelia strain d4-2]